MKTADKGHCTIDEKILDTRIRTIEMNIDTTLILILMNTRDNIIRTIIKTNISQDIGTQAEMIGTLGMAPGIILMTFDDSFSSIFVRFLFTSPWHAY